MSPLDNRVCRNTTSQMPTPPSSGVALRCAERWYKSLHTTFTSRREVPHLPPPFRSGQGGLTSPLLKGLTAQAAGYHQMGPNLTAQVLLQQTHGDQRILLLRIILICPRILPGPDIKTPRQAQSITFDEPWGGERGARIE